MKTDLMLTGWVGEVNFTAERVDQFLQQHAGEEVYVLIDSLGGDLQTAFSIAGAFANHGQVNVFLRGMNASAATIAATGAKRIVMDRFGLFLVHKCLTEVFEWALCNSDEMRAKAEEFLRTASEQEKLDAAIARMYAERTGKTADELLTLMGKDTWLTADEALQWGFIDATSEKEPDEQTEEEEQKPEEEQEEQPDEEKEEKEDTRAVVALRRSSKALAVCVHALDMAQAERSQLRATTEALQKKVQEQQDLIRELQSRPGDEPVAVNTPIQGDNDGGADTLVDERTRDMIRAFQTAKSWL